MNAVIDNFEKEAQAYADKTFQKFISGGLKITALHTYTNQSGKPIYWKARFKHPGTGKKEIRAFSSSDTGFQAKEPKFKEVYPEGNGKKPLYLLHALVTAAPDQVVFVCEGEQKADSLAKLGLIATTSGGSSSADSVDWTPLTQRIVRIWRDFDNVGQKYQDHVIEALEPLSCTIQTIDVDALNLPPKGDVIDWLKLREAQGLDTCATDVLALPVVTGNDYENLKKHQTNHDDLKSDGRSIKKTSSTKKASQGSEMFPQIEPWAIEVNGEILLDEIASLVERHIVCEPSTVTATTLWIAFSWCIEALQIAPIACITAPEKRCGKTQLLNLIGLLCRKPLPASNITAAAIFRSIEAFEPTLLIDEADSFLKNSEEMRGVINSGHSRSGAFVIRTVGDNFEPRKFSTWGAKAISGIGHLPDTLRDRSILLELRRKQPHETRERLRHADLTQFERLKRQLARWSQDNLDELKKSRPELPQSLNDRAQDNWESLLIIADQAGGHWSEKARLAAIAISGKEDTAPSINEELLTDIKHIFEQHREQRISTAELLIELCSDHEAAWCTWSYGKPMTARQLSKRLNEFGIKPRQQWIHGRNQNGYSQDQFEDAFKRYLSNPAVSSSSPLEANEIKESSDFSSSSRSDCLEYENHLKPNVFNSSRGLEDIKRRVSLKV
ncbi:MAG: DUF3631 domain-containing protein [Gammaproteobacteria bacterium]|nr:DUF3631 domain-containing protein [Gammaproteobacteria bacterium]